MTFIFYKIKIIVSYAQRINKEPACIGSERIPTMRESKGKIPYEIPNIEVLLVGDYILAADIINASNNIDKEGFEDAGDFFG